MTALPNLNSKKGPTLLENTTIGGEMKITDVTPERNGSIVWKTKNTNVASCQKLGESELVRTNLFALGSAKDISSEMFK